MGLFITIIFAIFAVFVVIVLHESGHFLVAKIFGVRVLRFSIGFGKTLWSRTSRAGTEYVLALLPLGGYVRLLDDREIPVSRKESRKAYNRQSLMVRMLIVLAGPVANIIVAAVVFWIIFLIGVPYVKPVIGKILPNSIAAEAGLQAGDTIKAVDDQPVTSWQQMMMNTVEKIGSAKPLLITTQAENGGAAQTHSMILQSWTLTGNQPDPLGSLGIIPYQPAFPAVIDKILPHSPASRAGLQSGDEILGLNQQNLADWPAVAEFIHNHPNQEVSLNIKRQGALQQVNVEVDSQSQKGARVGYLGILVRQPEWPSNMIGRKHYSIFSAWAPAVKETTELLVFNAIVLFKMFGGKISLGTLGGPISIFHTAYTASQAGLQSYLGFIAFISATLAFINILPIPGLDGGHFLFQVIEGIIRKPIPERYQMISLRIGIILIILLIVQGTINDIMRML